MTVGECALVDNLLPLYVSVWQRVFSASLGFEKSTFKTRMRAKVFSTFLGDRAILFFERLLGKFSCLV